MKRIKKIIGGLIVGTMLMAASHVLAAEQAKNVILMISDGMGFNTMKATDYYTGAPAVYESFSVKGSMNTSSAGASGGYVGVPYNPAQMWSNFNYQKSGYTDSASAATAMYTGVKNYDNQINKTTNGANLTTFFETASLQGKATGAVSTVNFDHATPATVVAKTTNRNDYATITSQMIASGLDVIMGAGHPFYNNSGQAVTANYSIVGNETNWNSITGNANGRTFIETKSDFEALANGTLLANKVFGVAQVRDTIQDSRAGAPGAAMNTNVPNLLTMTKAALNVLDNNVNGFAIMIEGGAVDWANHANGLKRSIDEQIDFNNSVQYVVDYLNAGSNGNNWNNTLLIVTADHETGALWGPTAGTFNQISDNGIGNLPGAVYNSGNHTNTLVPFFAKGTDAGLFNTYLTGSDPEMDNKYGIDLAFNSYIDNTDIFKVMSAAQNTAVPEPSVILLFGLGMAGLAAFRCK
ncbi:MAG: alkaline phosphatase [Deltaproteobacteria bacterium HGW-Deltaproteobacteria-12]|jgi:alkaline phosphatase|nr:MAG: alkaline phosphatase [Deltaproteobacteria bacterium HGW-Deltaproteobacteria-12]